jgi:hypothetical protein
VKLKLVSADANRLTVDPAGNAPEQVELELFDLQSTWNDESNTCPPAARLFCRGIRVTVREFVVGVAVPVRV